MTLLTYVLKWKLYCHNGPCT